MASVWENKLVPLLNSCIVVAFHALDTYMEEILLVVL